MQDESCISIGTDDRRLPIYLLVDTSGDMAGAPIEAIREALKQFMLAVQGDTFALETVYIGIITFGGRAEFITRGLIPFHQFIPPQIDASGQTPLGQALELLIESMDKDLRRPIIGGTKGDWKPLVFIFISSEPTDDWKGARERIRQRDSAKVCKVITVGCGPYINQQNLAAIAIGETFNIDNDDASFGKFFERIIHDNIDSLHNNVTLLSIEPDFIDLGCLKPGVTARTSLIIRGGPAKAFTNNAQIRVVPTEIGEETTEIEITVEGGEEGDLIWDSIQIDGIGGKLEVPIMGYWDKSLFESPEKPAVDYESGVAEKPEISELENRVIQKGSAQYQENRTFEYKPAMDTAKTYKPQDRIFTAPVCPICRRNLHYDSNTKSWPICEKCKSNVAVSLTTLASEEGMKGLQDFKKTAKDFWDVLSGKKTWDTK